MEFNLLGWTVLRFDWEVLKYLSSSYIHMSGRLWLKFKRLRELIIDAFTTFNTCNNDSAGETNN